MLRYLPRFEQAYRALREQEQREGWSREQIESFQLEQINRIWQESCKHVLYYQNLCNEHKLPMQFRSLSEYANSVPVLGKQTLRNQHQQLKSDLHYPGSWHLTGGSTGVPTRVYWSHQAHLENLRTRYRCQMMYGVDILERQAMLWGNPASMAPGSKPTFQHWKRLIIDRLRQRLRLSAYQLGPRDLQMYLDRIRRFRPSMLYGYSSAIYLLALAAEQTPWKCPSLKLIILSGEIAYQKMIDKINSGMNAPVSVEYGSVECGIIANQWPDSTLRVREDSTYVETVPRDDGKYDVLITGLLNPAFPLFRFKVGDLTEASLEKPDQGFSILHKLAGRANDMLRARSGRMVHSLSVKHVFEHYSNIRRFRAHQHDSGELEVLIELNDADPGFDRSDAHTKLDALLEGYPVTIKQVEQLPLTTAGKHRWVVSDLVN